MTENMFCRPGAELLQPDMDGVAEYAWDGGTEQPFVIEEWTMKPLRQFVTAESVASRVIEYDLEEYLDEDGNAVEHMTANAEKPEVIAAFGAALDLLFEGVSWSWADREVATWVVTWDAPATENGTPDFIFTRQ